MPGAERRLARSSSRLHEWVTTVDHKRLGIMYILYALLFLVVGGIEATIMRIQLMRPHNDFVSPQVFNRMFTMHGTTMIFFVAMPILFGFANYLVPLMIGARDMAFPRLNAFSFWMTAFGGFSSTSALSAATACRGGKRARRRMVRLRAADLADLLARAQHRLLDAVAAGLRHRQHRHGDQYHGHDPVHALPGHDAREDAAARLAESRDGRPGHSCRQSADRRADHAADRSLSRRPLLRHPGRRLGRDLDALLLDLRSPGSLRSGDSRFRLRVRDHSGVFAQGDLRLPDHGGGDSLASASSA